MHHARRRERRTGSNAAVNTTTDDARARRSNSTTGTASPSRNDDSHESDGATGNTATTSYGTAGKYGDPAGHAIADYASRHRAWRLDHAKWIE